MEGTKLFFYFEVGFHEVMMDSLEINISKWALLFCLWRRERLANGNLTMATTTPFLPYLAALSPKHFSLNEEKSEGNRRGQLV